MTKMTKLTRRRFLGTSAAILCAGAPLEGVWSNAAAKGKQDVRGRIFRADAPSQLWRWSQEGFSYKQLADGKVVCSVCPHRCLLKPGDRSVCRSKINLDGKLYSLAYGNPCAAHVDPIEKKPLYHFRPQSLAFSIATAGCNLRCLNCQNWEISQAKPHEVRHKTLMPRQVVATAQAAEAASIAYTYSEPVTFIEYMHATGVLAKQNGLANLMISAGYINRKPLLSLCPIIDAANINLKAFNDDIYRKLNGARLKPILDTLVTLKRQGVHLEVTHLVVPGYVDDDELAKQMCDWIVESLGQDVPLHFLRFFPRYKLKRLAPTPVSTLSRFRKIAMAAGIRYAYLGNVPGHDGNHTYCHHCGKMVIARQGYWVTTDDLVDGRCRFCNTPIPGVWS